MSSPSKYQRYLRLYIAILHLWWHIWLIIITASTNNLQQPNIHQQSTARLFSSSLYHHSQKMSMSATSTLTNLYIPLPIPNSTSDNNPLNRTRGQRTLRTLHLTRSPLSQSTGSSLIELGNTKLLVSVRGPRSCGRCSFGKEGGLACEGEFASFVSCFVSAMVLWLRSYLNLCAMNKIGLEIHLTGYYS